VKETEKGTLGLTDDIIATHDSNLMALSDDLLNFPHRLSAVRKEVAGLVAAMKATAGFLVDEEGTPFATVGHMEFRFPYPLTNLGGGDTLLKALVGESRGVQDEDEGSRYVVERVGKRALLVLLLESPLLASEQRAMRRRVRVAAKAIARLL